MTDGITICSTVARATADWLSAEDRTTRWSRPWGPVQVVRVLERFEL